MLLYRPSSGAYLAGGDSVCTQPARHHGEKPGASADVQHVDRTARRAQRRHRRLQALLILLVLKATNMTAGAFKWLLVIGAWLVSAMVKTVRKGPQLLLNNELLCYHS